MVTNVTTQPTPGSASGFLYVTQRATLPAVAPWATHYRRPISDTLHAEPFAMAFPVTRAEYGRAGVILAESSDLVMDSSRIFVRVMDLNGVYQERELSIDTFPSPDDSCNSLGLATPPKSIEAGSYRAYFGIRGRAWRAWLQREKSSITMAVYTADHGDEKGLAELTQRWLGLENGATFTSRLPFPPPYVEKVQATWWSTIPFAKRAYSVDFVLDRSQSVSFLFKCDGDGIKSLASLRLVSLVKEQLE